MPVFESDRQLCCNIENLRSEFSEKTGNPEFLSIIKQSTIEIERELFETINKTCQISDDEQSQAGIPQVDVLTDATIDFLIQAGEFRNCWLPDSAQFFLDYVRFRDPLTFSNDNTFIKAHRLIVELVNRTQDRLKESYDEERKLIFGIESQLSREEEQTIDFEFKYLVRSIDKRWQILARGLSICRQAALLFKITDKFDWLPNFERGWFANFKSIITKHMDQLRRKRIAVFVDILSDRYQRQKKAVTRDQLLQEARQRSVQMKLLSQETAYPRKKTLELLRRAMIQAYDPLFECIRNLLVSAARRASQEKEEVDILEEIKAVQIAYVTDLREHRVALAEAMDVDGVREADDRMAFNQRRYRDELCAAYEESFREWVIDYIQLYEDNLIGIDEESDAAEDKHRRELNERFEELHEKQHLDALVLTEMKYQFRIVQEVKRIERSGSDVEAQVKKLLTQGQYTEAERAKKGLEERRRREIKAKKEEIDKQRRIAIKTQIIEQENELKLLQDTFNSKIELLRAERERVLAGQRSQFISALAHEIPKRGSHTSSILNGILNPQPEERSRVRNSAQESAKRKEDTGNEQNKFTRRYHEVLREVLTDEVEKRKNNNMKEVLDYFKRK
jgi:hypothetical protein